MIYFAVTQKFKVKKVAKVNRCRTRSIRLVVRLVGGGDDHGHRPDPLFLLFLGPTAAGKCKQHDDCHNRLNEGGDAEAASCTRRRRCHRMHGSGASAARR